MQLLPLSEGTFTVDKSKQFLPFEMGRDELSARTTGSLLVEIQPFLVIIGREIMLLDTGLGFKEENRLQLFKNLESHGITPTQVTRVLLSHLHKDHAGGISFEEEGKRKLSFENAKYYVQKRELELALSKAGSSFVVPEFELLKDSSQVEFLQDDRGVIDDFISYEVTGAHSKFHQVFWIRNEGQVIFFGGDDAPQLQQMKHRFVAKYDYDGKKAMELRSQWWEKGSEEGWVFLFYHDVRNAVYANGR